MSSKNTARDINTSTSARFKLKPRNLLARISLYFALTIVLLLFVIWLAIPPAAKWYASDFYEQRNRTFTASDIGVNFFPPAINLKEIEVLNEQTPELKINKLALQISLLPLFQKIAHVSKAEIKGLYLFTSQDENNLTVAGITIPTSETSKENPQLEVNTEESTPWSVSVPNFTITDSEFKVHNILKDGLTDTIKIARLQADDLKNQGTDLSTKLDLDLFFNEHSSLVLNADIDYTNALAKVALSSLSVVTDVDDITHFLPTEYQNIAGKVQTSVRGSVQQKGATEFDIKLSDFNTELNNVEVGLPDLTTNFDQYNLNITSLDVSNTETSDFQLAASLRTSLTNFDTNIQKNKINGDGIVFAVKDIQIKKKDDQVNITTPSVALNSKNIEFKSDTVEASSNETQVELDQLSLSLAGNNAIDLSTALTTNLLNSEVNASSIHLNNKKLSTQFADISFSMRGENIQATVSNTKLNNSAFKLSESDNTLAALKSLDIDSPKLFYSNNEFEGEFRQINMNQISLSDMANAPALTTLEQLTIKNTKANANSANIDDIQLIGLNVNVLLDESRQLINLVTMPELGSEEHIAQSDVIDVAENAERKEQSNERVNAPEDNTDRGNADNGNSDNGNSDRFDIFVNTFDLTGDSYIQLLDKGVEPDLDTRIDLEKLSATHIDSTDPDSWTHIELDAKNGKYSTIDLDADLQPFAEQLTLKSKLAIRETDLPPYSPYIAQALGYRIESGQMDADLTLESNQGQLEGNTHLVFREFDLGGRQESNQVMQTGAMPLNIAVGVLKDGQGNIELDIPLEGNVDNPEFKWTGFLMLPIKQALYKASASYLMQTFVPYANVISIAQIAGEQILKIRVEPLTFEPQQGQIIASQHEYLNQLAALMTDKADSQVKACGVATLVDLGEEGELTIAEPEQQNVYLNDLANERANALKDYLVEKGIASNRIFVCAPEIDRDDDATPSVRLKF